MSLKDEIKELEDKIEELKVFSKEKNIDFSKQIEELEKELFNPDAAERAEIDAGCRSASIGCVDCKKMNSRYYYESNWHPSHCESFKK